MPEYSSFSVVRLFNAPFEAKIISGSVTKQRPRASDVETVLLFTPSGLMAVTTYSYWRDGSCSSK